jgi:hypothetical protein
MPRSPQHQDDHGRGAKAPSRAALRDWYVSHLREFHGWRETKTPVQTIDDLARRHDRWHLDDGQSGAA